MSTSSSSTYAKLQELLPSVETIHEESQTKNWVRLGRGIAAVLIAGAIVMGVVFGGSNDHPSPSLSATPSTLSDSHGEYVTITWKGVRSATVRDWVGIYSLPYTTGDDYFDMFKPAMVSESGNFTYFFVNMRTNYLIKYWRYDYNLVDFYVDASATVSFEQDPNTPLQGHLSLTDDDKEMRVMWVTDSSYVPNVQYGLAPGLYSSTATGSSITYTASMMCGAPANVTSEQTFRPPGYIHDVVLDNLAYNTIYYYRFGNEQYGYSPEYSFRSRPAPSAALAKGTNFLVYGDMGTYDSRCGCSGARSTTSKITADVLQDGYIYDFAMHIGDISYARGRGYMWDQFFLQIEQIATRIPYMIGIGNHDYDHSVYKQDPSGAQGNGFHPSWGNYGDDSDGECSVPTYYRFHMPNSTENNKMSPFWYSYDLGLAHFVVISTEHNFTTGSPQYLWLQSDLQKANANRANVPWIVLFGHRPMYESENYASDSLVASYIQAYLEDLLFENKVNLALWGHYHSYQRTCPVYQNLCSGNNASPNATVHITVGSAGADLDDATLIDVPWAMFTTFNWGYSRVLIHNSTSLQVEFVSTNNDVMDSVSLSSWA
jgi:hypothetical protein